MATGKISARRSTRLAGPGARRIAFKQWTAFRLHPDRTDIESVAIL
jgi:hypothetical protein